MTWEYLIFASGFLSFHDTRGNLYAHHWCRCSPGHLYTVAYRH